MVRGRRLPLPPGCRGAIVRDFCVEPVARVEATTRAKRQHGNPSRPRIRLEQLDHVVRSQFWKFVTDQDEVGPEVEG
jgi:hypothetical protein